MRGRVLIVAGSDSGGGAGIQADIKAVTALGGFAATAVTALTAQNTRGVFGIVGVEPAFVAEQMRVVLGDIGADCIKTGMLHSTAIIEAVVAVLADAAPDVPLVVDPVMVAKGGASLLAAEAQAVLVERLLPRATIVTPNVPEAEVLSGRKIVDLATQRQAAAALLGGRGAAVLLKGGHLPGQTITDVLATPDGIDALTGPRLDTPHTHGTGCTLASAVATGLAQSMGLHAAVARARRYVNAAIAAAPGYGAGHGPLDHGVTVDPARFDR